uniref:Neur_chan_memb domain-containing protein n=1 Tax=Caenorhabditis tropicalis TaxID=1561998 RepID=A0A1I7TL01_9PELO
MFYQSVFVSCVFGIVIVATFPIEIKDIQYLFPPQNTILSDPSSSQNSGYETKIDRQLGDSEEEDKIRKSCIQKQNADKSKSSEEKPTEVISDGSSSFNDTTPLNGTLVEDPMEVKIYRPECDN